MHTTPPASDFTEPLLAILSRYVSAPTAQSILKLARQRAGVISTRLDRAGLADMFASIERHIRLFIGDPSKVSECRAAILVLVEGRPAAPAAARSSEPAQGRGGPPASSRSSEPAQGRSIPPASSRSSEPVSVRSIPPASVLSSIPSYLVQIRVEDDIARARSEARDLSSTMGFSVVGRTRLVTAVSELARNIVLYAREGQIELTPLATPAGITVVAGDRGPGIPNLEQIMVGDYKSRLGMGLGLRGVKRLADRFEIQTAVGQGTTVTCFLKVI